MKKIFLITLVLSFGFSHATLADVGRYPVIPFELPYTTQGYTFTAFHCVSELPTASLRSRCYYTDDLARTQLKLVGTSLTRKIESLAYSPAGHYIGCLVMENGTLNSNCYDVLNTGYGGGAHLAGFTFNSTDHAYSVPIYNDFIPNNTEVLYPANYPPPTLNITRSPELGGGVTISVPPLIQYECGINSCMDCELETDPNIQVTLQESHNEGYAFSHWEINDLAMADVDGSIDVTMDEDKVVKAVFKPVFGFPFSDFTSTNVPISAVMDHSLTGGFYTADGRNNQVEAFNGLIANGTQHSYNGNVYCYDTAETNPFPGLNYSYGSEICYDEHPGFDFAVVNGTNVLAPFAGKLYWATTDPVNDNPSTYGTFYIDHENGYTTWFLHCSGLTQTVVDEIALNGYAEVIKGQHIAESSDKGSSGSYHLHFEVRKDGVDDEHVIDPYGWELWEQ